MIFTRSAIFTPPSKVLGVLDYFARSVAQWNYQLKDEDFAALAFLSQVENDNGRNYNEKTSNYWALLFSHS